MRRAIWNFSIAFLSVLAISWLFPTVHSGAFSQTASSTNIEAIAPNSGVSLMQIARQQYEGEQFLAAAQTLAQAITNAESSHDKLQQSQASGLQALALQKLGRWDEAKASISQSLSLLSTLRTETTAVSRVRGQILNAQGQLQFALGQADQALESWETAEQSYQQANAPSAALGSRINQIQALQSLGFYRRAENLLDKIETDIRTSLDPSIQIKGLLSLGDALRLGGEVERSQTVLSEGLAIARSQQQPSEEGQALLNLGNTERVLANRAAAIGESAASEQHSQTALQHYQAAQSVSPTAIAQVQAQLNQLSLLVEMDQTETVKRLRSQLISAIEQLPPSRAAIYARVNLSQRSMEIALTDAPALAEPSLLEIAKQLATAIQQARTIQDARAESYALGTLGMLYEKTGNLTEAETVTETALQIAQSILAPDIAYQWQWQMGRLLRSERPDNPAAIAYYTAAVETLNGLRSDLVALNPDIQFSFRESVEPVYRQLVDLLLSSESPSIERLRQAREVMEDLQLAELDNFFRDACAQPEPVTIDTVDSTAAIVYPILLEDRLAVIVKLPGDDYRYYANNEIGEEQVDLIAQRLLSGLRRRSTLPADIQAESQQLYQWLLAPFSAELEHSMPRAQSQIETLVFVLEGSLRNIPMSVLYDGQQYLVERYAIALTPGLQLLSPQALRQNSLRVLVAGATDAPSFAAAGFSDLSSVEFEIEGVEESVSQSTSLENENFLQATVREKIQATPFDVVHLATHGNFSSNPDRTFLLDWDSRISANDIDTLFQVNDPSQEKFVELLVLSACETATGDDRAALGLAGIAIRADVRSTLATLWQVNDTSTAEFMIRFYEQLGTGKMTKAEAVRSTQIAFLKEYSETDYNRPFHWAPFTLVGNWL